MHDFFDPGVECVAPLGLFHHLFSLVFQLVIAICSQEDVDLFEVAEFVFAGLSQLFAVACLHVVVRVREFY